MFYITGDLHGEIDMHKLSVDAFPEQKNLTESDYMIICGDFGCIWTGGNRDKYLLKELSARNFTTLFVDGNHENFLLLNSYPVEQWNGGKIHRIMPNILHLMRGQWYNITGTTFFTMGGATSHDKQFRKEGVSWWPGEIPSEREYDEALAAMEKHPSVDYIITHCAPDSTQDILSNGEYGHNRLTNFLQTCVEGTLEYKAWFFGHYHTDQKVDGKHFALYQQIIELPTFGTTK